MNTDFLFFVFFWTLVFIGIPVLAFVQARNVNKLVWLIKRQSIAISALIVCLAVVFLVIGGEQVGWNPRMILPTDFIGMKYKLPSSFQLFFDLMLILAIVCPLLVWAKKVVIGQMKDRQELAALRKELKECQKRNRYLSSENAVYEREYVKIVKDDRVPQELRDDLLVSCRRVRKEAKRLGIIKKAQDQ